MKRCLPLMLLATFVRGDVTYDRLLHPEREPHNWLTYSGNYSSHRYSPLTQINASNVKDLQMKWVYHPLYVKTTNNQSKMENTPLVVDGILYTGTALEVVALDAVTGRQYWKYPRPLDPKPTTTLTKSIREWRSRATRCSGRRWIAT